MLTHSHLLSSKSKGRLAGSVARYQGWKASRQVTASVTNQQRAWQPVSNHQQQQQQQQQQEEDHLARSSYTQASQQQQREQIYSKQTPQVNANHHGLTGSQTRRPSVQERADFDSLWAGFKKELQLSKEAAAAISQRVYQGQLPCDAPFLRTRALQLIALDASFPDMRFRTLLSSHSATLAHLPELLGDRARRLQRLLPHQDITTVMATVMEHMSASADILALWLCELELPFQEVFKMGVPPSVFSHFYNQAATAAALDSRRSRQVDSTSMASQVFPTCDTFQILERCKVLRELVGPESGYAMLRRCPALLDIAPDLMRGRVASLQTGLSLHDSVELCRVMEGAPTLLALEEGDALLRAERLQGVLGWSKTGVRALILARSQVLLVETELAARKLLLLREAAAAGSSAGRDPWCLELLGPQCEADAMARVLLSGWEVLGRVQYLASRPMELGGMRATEALEESRQAFARAVPRYSRWWVENGRQLVDVLGFEEEESTRDGRGWIQKGNTRAEDEDNSLEGMGNQVVEERLRGNGNADQQFTADVSPLTSNPRQVRYNRSHSGVQVRSRPPQTFGMG